MVGKFITNEKQWINRKRETVWKNYTCDFLIENSGCWLFKYTKYYIIEYNSKTKCTNMLYDFLILATKDFTNYIL